jgi:hypothetical protein
MRLVPQFLALARLAASDLMKACLDTFSVLWLLLLGCKEWFRLERVDPAKRIVSVNRLMMMMIRYKALVYI